MRVLLVATAVALLTASASRLQGRQSSDVAIVSAAASIAGLKALSVDIQFFGDERSKAMMESVATRALTAVGIKILPPGAYPSLTFSVRGRSAMVGSGLAATLYVIGSARLEVMQVVTLPSIPPRRVPASIWSTGLPGWSLRSDYDGWALERLNEQLQEFSSAYRGGGSSTPTNAGGLSSTTVTSPVATPPIVAGIMNYGRVPEDFVPPIPGDLKGLLRMDMQKTAPGALVSVGVGWLSSAQFLDWNPLLRTSPKGDQEILFDDITAIGGESDQANILACEYKTTNRPRRLFWYKVEPFNAAPERLRKRMANHPLLVVNPAVPHCPPNLEAAIKASQR